MRASSQCDDSGRLFALTLGMVRKFPPIILNRISIEFFRTVFSKATSPESIRYSDKSFRRGYSNGVEDSGPARCQIISAAGRGAAGYRRYLRFRKDEQKFIDSRNRLLCQEAISPGGSIHSDGE